MNITGDVIRRLMMICGDSELPTVVDEIVNIQVMIEQVRSRRIAAQKAHDVESEIANREEMDARSKCSHWITQEHKSPVDSWNNWTECLVCGKSIN